METGACRALKMRRRIGLFLLFSLLRGQCARRRRVGAPRQQHGLVFRRVAPECPSPTLVAEPARRELGPLQPAVQRPIPGDIQLQAGRIHLLRRLIGR